MRDGLIAHMTVAENYILDSYHREPYSTRGSLNSTAAIDDGAESGGQGLRHPDARRSRPTPGSLSGGNQQKVVVAREFSRPVKLVIASQPTRGLDVGSIEYIHKRIVEQRDAGAAILIVSTELDEVLAVGDRIAVMFGGRDRGGPGGRRGDLREGRDAHGRRASDAPAQAPGPGASSRSSRSSRPSSSARVFILITDFDNLSKLGTDPARRDRRRARQRSSTPTASMVGRGASATRPRSRPRSADPQPTDDRGGHPPDHRDARRRHPADLHRPRRRDLVPQRRVQHRRRGPVHPRRVRAPRSRRSLLAGPAGAADPAIVAIARGRPDRRRLGLHPGLPQGADGRPRGHHHDHAQLRRRADRPVRPALRLPAPGGQLAADLEGPARRSCASRMHLRPAAPSASHWGFVVALVMAVVVSWFLFKTTKGFELRAAGFNLTAARYAGHERRAARSSSRWSLSGGLAGLGGSVEVLGTVPQMSNDISSGFGFNAIALALLAGNRPVGIVAGRAAVRGAADRRRVDAGQDRHPARPPVLHPGAGDHVRRRPGPDPRSGGPRTRRRTDAETPTRRRGAGMTAAEPPPSSSSSARLERRRARGAARPPGSAASCSRSLGLFALQRRDQHVGRHRDVLVLDRQAGRRAVHAHDDRRRPVARWPASSTGAVGMGQLDPRRPRSRGAARC